MNERPWTHPSAMVESHLIGSGTRVWAFSHVMQGAVVGRDCNLGEHVFVEGGALIGDRVTIKNGVQIWRGVTLADDVFVGPNAVFTNDRYPRSPRSEAAQFRYESERWLLPTVVHRGASIGANATVICGVDIGRYSMIAAGSLVSKPVPAFALVVGIPARLVGHVCMCGQPLEKACYPECLICGRQYAQQGQLLDCLTSPAPTGEANQ